MKKTSGTPSMSTALTTFSTTTSLHVAYVQPLVQRVANPATELVAVKAMEKSSKLGRRYSFDDNGGGYLGL
jgi:hypothetical protein